MRPQDSDATPSARRLRALLDPSAGPGHPEPPPPTPQAPAVPQASSAAASPARESSGPRGPVLPEVQAPGAPPPEDDPEPGESAGRVGDYELVTRLRREESSVLWYARCTAEGDDPAAPDPRTRIGEAAAARGPVRALERGYLDAARRRLARERMVRVYLPPEGAAAQEQLIRSATRWAEQVSARAPGLRHPHLLHVYGADAADPLSPLLISEFPEGGGLAEVLAARERISPAECAGVVAHLCRALSWLHAQDLVHGGLDAGAVFFTRSSQTLLRPPLPDPWREAEEGLEPAEDVWALAELAWLMLTGRPPGPEAQRAPLPLMCPGIGSQVVAVLEEALDPDPQRRPRVQEIMQVFRGALQAEPVDLHASVREEFAGRLPRQREGHPGGAGPRRAGPGSGEQVEEAEQSRDRLVYDVEDPGTRKLRRTGRSRRRSAAALRLSAPARRRRALVLGAAGLLGLSALAVGGGLLLRDGQEQVQPLAQASAETADPASTGGGSEGGSGASEHAVSSAEPRRSAEGESPAAAEDPAAALGGLLAARDEALRSRDAALLARYAVPDQELATQDAQLIRRLQETDTDWSGLRSTVQDPEPISRSGSEAIVRTTLRVQGYRTQEPAQAGEGRARGDKDGAEPDEQRIEVRLRAESGAWRIESVRVL
ncbi:protein kinase [Rothia kristinae]|uniref:protein kinase n=1 Tax=Rothia kristinae TaxID=37923 RepID=UPI001CD54AE2|nr:protein kinase [Rothia kristinae]MCA1168810.1 protein kinase [Rothia kristinae]